MFNLTNENEKYSKFMGGRGAWHKRSLPDQNTMLTVNFLCKRLSSLLISRASLSGACRAMSTSIKTLPDGAYPTMITPFLNDEKKSIDWNTLDRMCIG